MAAVVMHRRSGMDCPGSRCQRDAASWGPWRAGFAALLLALLAACGGGSSGPEPAASSPARARLLSAQQYHNAIASVFGDDVAEAAVAPMPPMQRVDGLLASGAASMGLTSDQASQIQQTASAVAALVVDSSHRHYLVPCTPVESTTADATCATTFLAATGRLLLRRPLAPEQLDSLVTVADHGATQLQDFYAGLALALETLLIHPGFLFHVDAPASTTEDTGPAALDPYALASRLSFFLWNSPPDAALLDAAAAGRLDTPDGLAAEVDRLLASPRLTDGMRAFFDDMLGFNAFDSLAKDPMVYPNVTGRTLTDAREQTLRTVTHHLLDEAGDYRDLFTTRDTFLSPALAAVYGIPAAAGWNPHTFDEASERHGLLTHVSFLAANSHAVRSSPTQRGKALRERLLCQHVPDPPPNVDFSQIEEAGDAATARERLAAHNSNPSCAGCHLITDPMGLALENFDGAGAWRDTENGATIDISGELDGVFFDDIGGLAGALRNHPKLSFCLVNRLYAYGTGGPVSLKRDRDTLKWFEEQFVEQEYRLPALLKTLATSATFTHVSEVTR